MTTIDIIILSALVVVVVVKLGLWLRSRTSTHGILGRLAGAAERQALPAVQAEADLRKIDLGTLVRHILARIDADDAEAKQAEKIKAVIARLKAPPDVPKS